MDNKQPSTIYLHRGDGEVAWCEDKIDSDDVEYVRADTMIAGEIKRLHNRHKHLNAMLSKTDLTPLGENGSAVLYELWQFICDNSKNESEVCLHSNAVSARNKVVQSGLFCPDCNSILAEMEV